MCLVGARAALLPAPGSNSEYNPHSAPSGPSSARVNQVVLALVVDILGTWAGLTANSGTCAPPGINVSTSGHH